MKPCVTVSFDIELRNTYLPPKKIGTQFHHILWPKCWDSKSTIIFGGFFPFQDHSFTKDFQSTKSQGTVIFNEWLSATSVKPRAVILPMSW